MYSYQRHHRRGKENRYDATVVFKQQAGEHYQC
jgi:hypothetical protein